MKSASHIKLIGHELQTARISARKFGAGGGAGAAGEGRIGHEFGSSWYWCGIGLLSSCLLRIQAMYRGGCCLIMVGCVEACDCFGRGLAA